MRPRGDDQQTIQGIAEHLARESGGTPARCWSEALSLWRVTFEKRVLALDGDGRVVDLGDVETIESE